ncbi:MAG: hypothetical protein ACRDQH_03400 [Pseudonocardiaceae bacterium]
MRSISAVYADRLLPSGSGWFHASRQTSAAALVGQVGVDLATEPDSRGLYGGVGQIESGPWRHRGVDAGNLSGSGMPSTSGNYA